MQQGGFQLRPKNSDKMERASMLHCAFTARRQKRENPSLLLTLSTPR